MVCHIYIFLLLFYNLFIYTENFGIFLNYFDFKYVYFFQFFQRKGISMLNFVMCDDNLNALNKLSHMFESVFMKYDLKAQIAFKTTNEHELLSYVKENPTDVIILDINLKSNLTGLDIASQLRKAHNNSYIIFTTAHAEFVFLAYKCKTFDFLCKPVTQERLEETVLRLFDDIKNNSSEKSYIRLDNKNTIIDGNEVQYIKRDGMKIIFHTKSRDYEVYSSFAKIQSHLPKNFIRCHKSFIANVNNIEKIEPTSNLVYFKNNDTCDIGPKYKEDFMKGVCTFGYVE